MSISSIETGTLNNFNNKFGECCGCPALGLKDTLFTSYVSHSIYNDQQYKKNGITNSHEYRLALQTNAETIINNESTRYDKIKCVSNNKQIFYIDSSNYNFTDKLSDSYNGLKIQNYDTKSDFAKF